MKRETRRRKRKKVKRVVVDMQEMTVKDIGKQAVDIDIDGRIYRLSEGHTVRFETTIDEVLRRLTNAIQQATHYMDELHQYAALLKGGKK